MFWFYQNTLLYGVNMFCTRPFYITETQIISMDKKQTTILFATPFSAFFKTSKKQCDEEIVCEIYPVCFSS